MKNSFIFLNVCEPIGNVQPGIVVILYGDAPAYRYCYLTQKCIAEGAGVVAVAHGIDVSTNGGDAIVVHSVEETYCIGKTLDECNPNEIEGGTVVKVVRVNGKEYIRDDKNCVAEDLLRDVPTIAMSEE